MFIPDNLINGLEGSTRPVVLYRNENGEVVYGFVLRPDEFVTSLRQMAEARKCAGMSAFDKGDNPL
ncbi:hypothetical protein SMZ81_004362 [Cronobacter sakazakii]|nr:hypothetical protein [Cronobacter sakazakii]